MRLVRKHQKRPSHESGNPDGRRCVLDSCLRRNDDKDAGMNGVRTSLLCGCRKGLSGKLVRGLGRGQIFLDGLLDHFVHPLYNARLWR